MDEEPTLRPAGAGERPVFERLWQLYRHDMSEFVNSLPDRYGLFKTRRLEEYLSTPDHQVLMMWSGEIPIGFVTVGRTESGRWTIGDYFVIRRMRRRGIGLKVALDVIGHIPGAWEVGFQASNKAAVSLWRQVAQVVSGGYWDEERRPVPGKPDVPPDAFVLFDSPGSD